MWQNQETGQLHIVDYKSTAQLGKEPRQLNESFLNDKWKAAYKRQMEMYQWIMKKKGFDVSSRGYFLYVDGQHIGKAGMISKDQPSRAYMEFKTSIIPYDGRDDWVEDALYKIKELLLSENPPEHAEGCEYARFLGETKSALKN